MTERSSYLFLNSMSRTGTSLLYQLLYGHSGIVFPNYRIQFACSRPLGFPLLDSDEIQDSSFFETLLSKTTTPVEVSENTQWSNIQIVPLAKQEQYANASLKISEASPSKENENGLDRARVFLDRLLGRPEGNGKYYCLHDDHSYALGSAMFHRVNARVLTTIRSPIDMLASKKNMLLFHLFGTTIPQTHEMTPLAIEKELSRAVFSWWVASFELENDQAYYPVLFEHLKGERRTETMKRLVNFLGLPYEECLSSDETFQANNVVENELLYAGSSLAFVTKGESSRTVGASKVSLTDEERRQIEELVDVNEFLKLVEAPPDLMYQELKGFWRRLSVERMPALKTWIDLYQDKKFTEAFEKYSSFNYGFRNAKEAF